MSMSTVLKGKDKDHLKCEVCEISCSPTSWDDHLVSPEHQSKNLQKTYKLPDVDEGTIGSEFMAWDCDKNERSIVVTAFRHLVTHPAELLKHFRSFGVGTITDFVFDPERYFAIVQFGDRKAVKQLIKQRGCNMIKNQYIRLRCKDSISMKEWIVVQNLDGIYDTSDLPFYLHHAEVVSALAGEPIDTQFNRFISLTGSGQASMRYQMNIISEVYAYLRPRFPVVTLAPTDPLKIGLLDRDAICELYMDPFGRCGEYAGRQPYYSDFSSPKYQAAIRHIVNLMQNKPLSTLKPNMDNPFISVTPVLCGLPVKKKKKSVIRAITFHHLKSGIRCRIRFDNVMDAHLGSLIAFLATLDSRIIPIIRLLRHWARIHRFTRRYPEINNVLTMLVLVVFQKMNLMNSVHVLQELYRIRENFLLSTNRYYYTHPQKRGYCEGWDISFLQDIGLVTSYMKEKGKIPCLAERMFYCCTTNNTPRSFSVPTIAKGGTKCILRILAQLFAAVADIHFPSYVLSPFYGDILPRSAFKPRNVHKLPRCYNFYKIQSANYPLNTAPSLVIQHPFALNRNVASRIPKSVLEDFKVEAVATYKRIQSVLESSESDPCLMDIYPGVEQYIKRKPFKP